MLKRIDPRHRCQEDLSWPDQLRPWSIAEQNVHEEWVPEHRSVLTILTWLKMPGHSQLRIRRSVLFSLCISMCEVWLAPATAVRGSVTGNKEKIATGVLMAKWVLALNGLLNLL